ncbi:MAG TPA: hypothetical protein VGM92_00340 [Candidatus Kapabacteria bacterium]
MVEIRNVLKTQYVADGSDVMSISSPEVPQIALSDFHFDKSRKKR